MTQAKKNNHNTFYKENTMVYIYQVFGKVKEGNKKQTIIPRMKRRDVRILLYIYGQN